MLPLYFTVLRGYEATEAEEETETSPSSGWGVRNPISLCGGVVHLYSIITVKTVLDRLGELG